VCAASRSRRPNGFVWAWYHPDGGRAGCSMSDVQPEVWVGRLDPRSRKFEWRVFNSIGNMHDNGLDMPISSMSIAPRSFPESEDGDGGASHAARSGARAKLGTPRGEVRRRHHQPQFQPRSGLRCAFMGISETLLVSAVTPDRGRDMLQVRFAFTQPVTRGPRGPHGRAGAGG